MIDDDDVTLWVLGGPGGIFGLLIFIFMMYAACENTKECSQKKCDHGSPVLMKHECLCVEKAK